jgi:hypothetical protein
VNCKYKRSGEGMRVERTVTEEPRRGVSVVKQYVCMYGNRAEAILLYNGHHLKNADESVKEYCHSSFSLSSRVAPPALIAQR